MKAEDLQPEEILSDEERMSMLSKVFNPKRVDESKKVSAVGPGSPSSPSLDRGEVVPKDSEGSSPSLESFGTLLEKTLARRQVLDKKENDVTDQDRQYAIKESRKDLIGDMVKTFFK